MNRVKLESTATGDGVSITCSVPVGFQDPTAEEFTYCSGGQWYYLLDADGTNWEYGFGSIGSTFLARNTVLESTNSNNRIVLSAAGTHTVICDRGPLEGQIIQQVLGRGTPVAISAGTTQDAGNNEPDTLDYDGISMLGLSGTGVSNMGSLLDPSANFPMYRAVRFYGAVKVNSAPATGGMLGIMLCNDYDQPLFSGWSPLVSGQYAVANFTTPWFERQRVDGSSGFPPDILTTYGNIRLNLGNTGGVSVTPDTVQVIAEYKL
jgi:hypothetical protein